MKRVQLTAAELEQRAERAVRRGELLVALEHFEAYLAQWPDDERIRRRIESVRSLLQPSELVNRKRAGPPGEPDAPEPVNDAEQGELSASSGRYAEAIAAYERAVSAHPDNALLSDRLEELRRMTDTSARADLRGGEALGGPEPAAGQARAPRAGKAPRPPASKAESSRRPRDLVDTLRDLLDRVRAGRRPRP